MSLPTFATPLFELTIPSTQHKVSFRPFLVKEEKLLLLAKEEATPIAILNAIKQVITSCVQEKLVFDTLTSFDVEYMFLKIRGKSVNNIIDFNFIDHDDKKEYPFQVNIDEIEVDIPKVDFKLPITDTGGIILKYPTIDSTVTIDTTNADTLTTTVVASCIKAVYDDENVYMFEEQTADEQKKFIDSLDVKTYNKIQEFLINVPRLKYVFNYTNAHGTDKEVTLEGIRDFFTWD